MISHKNLWNNFFFKNGESGTEFYFLGVQYFILRLNFFFNKNHGKSSLLDLKKSTPVVAT